MTENQAVPRSGLSVGLDADLERELRARINPIYEDVRGTESFERKRMLGEIDRLRAALRISTNGLRHCANWNIREEKAQALMAVVMENENILATKAANEI